MSKVTTIHSSNKTVVSGVKLIYMYLLFFPCFQVQLLKTSHQQELGRITNDLEDETYSRNNMDKRLGNLRKEVPKIWTHHYWIILRILENLFYSESLKNAMP